MGSGPGFWAAPGLGIWGVELPLDLRAVLSRLRGHRRALGSLRIGGVGLPLSEQHAVGAVLDGEVGGGSDCARDGVVVSALVAHGEGRAGVVALAQEDAS